jgi:hypothetical protein
VPIRDTRKFHKSEPFGVKIRLTIVSGRTDQENSNTERLRADYKGAFEEWALQVNHLQAMSTSPCGTKEAEARVAVAEAAYRNTRDRLTEDMAFDSVKTAPRD